MNVNVNSGTIDIALLVLVVFFLLSPFFCLFVCLFVCLLFVSNWRNIQGGLFNANILIIFIRSTLYLLMDQWMFVLDF